MEPSSRLLHAIVLAGLAAGCGARTGLSSDALDGSTDLDAGTPRDGGRPLDAGRDAGVDAGRDAGVDAGMCPLDPPYINCCDGEGTDAGPDSLLRCCDVPTGHGCDLCEIIVGCIR